MKPLEVYAHTGFLENKGITLIALVITIIILLILSGITVATLTGDNGLLKRAVSSKEQSEIAQEIETLQQASVAAMGKSISGDVEKEHLDTELSKHSEIEKTSEVSDGIEVTFKSGRAYTVSANGNVTQKTPRIYSDEVKAALTEGKYVTYNGKTYRVLYDVNSGYDWIEIVSVEPLENVKLGSTDFNLPSNEELTNQGYGTSVLEKARWSYNNVITTLHSVAQNYLTDLADRARCLGSDPEHPEYDVKELGYMVTEDDINSYVKTKGYNNKFKIAAENYTKGTNSSALNKDKEQLDLINATSYRRGAGDYCWLSSRSIIVNANGTSFSIPRNKYNGSIDDRTLFDIGANGGYSFNGEANGFRPVIRLKDSIKITGGSGTSGSPYTIGL